MYMHTHTKVKKKKIFKMYFFLLNVYYKITRIIRKYLSTFIPLNYLSLNAVLLQKIYCFQKQLFALHLLYYSLCSAVAIYNLGLIHIPEQR